MNRSRKVISPDASHWVEDSLFHDSEVVSVAVKKTPDRENLCLGLITVDNKRFELILCGVAHFQCDGFSDQNVVSEIYVMTGKEGQVRFVESLKGRELSRPVNIDEISAKIREHR